MNSPAANSGNDGPENCVRCDVTTEDKDERGVCVFCLHDEDDGA